MTKRLIEAIKATNENAESFKDSPLYELVENYPNVQHEKTDVFRDRVNYSNEIKALLSVARSKREISAVREVENKMDNLSGIESAAVLDLF